MVNCRQKGRHFELLAKKFYEEKGWLIELVKPGQKWQKQQDLFGVFDLIGIKKTLENGTFGGRTWNAQKLFVQVKCNPKWLKHDLEILQEFRDKYLWVKDIVMLLAWKRGEGFIQYKVEER